MLPYYRTLPFSLFLLLTVSLAITAQDTDEETLTGDQIELTEASPYKTGDISLETPQPFQTFDIEVDDATNSIDDNRKKDEEE